MKTQFIKLAFLTLIIIAAFSCKKESNKSSTNPLIKYNGPWVSYYGLSGMFVNSIAVDSQGNKWCGIYHRISVESVINKGIAEFNGSSWILYNTDNSGLLSNEVHVIAVDKHNNKWIGTAGGLSKFDGSNWTNYSMSNSSLASNWIWSIAFDNSGNVWIGTNGGGISKFDGTNWTSYAVPDGLANNSVSTIAIDGQGNKWFGTYGYGVFKFDNINWTIYNTNNSGLVNDGIYVIAIDKQGNKWIGTNGGGLSRFDGANWTTYTINGMDSGIAGITFDASGDEWILASEGLSKFNGVNWTQYLSSVNDSLSCMSIDTQGNKWFGTNGGINELKNGN